MSKVSRSISWTSLALGLTVTLPAMSAAQQPAPVPQPQTPGVEAAAQVAQAPVVVELAAVGDAEGSGEATLKATGEQTEAVVEVEGLAPGTEWSAFLIAGTCDEPGAAITPLGTIEVADMGSGRGEASVTAALAELASGAATVQVHPQGETPTQAVLCGALPAVSAGPEIPVF